PDSAPDASGAADAPNPADPRPLDLADLIERVEPAVVRLEVEMAQGRTRGSGFVVDERGTMITNFHVLDGARSARAMFSDGTTVDLAGTLLLLPEQDIAVARLKLDGEPRQLAVLRLAPEPPRKGEGVIAFGAPQGLSFTASQGIVSALRTSGELEREVGERIDLQEASLIQTDAAISPGSSGGPLVNRAGEVVGVTTLTHRIGQNLNFAVSSRHVMEALREAGNKSLVAFSPTAQPTAGPTPIANAAALQVEIEAALLEQRRRFSQEIEQRRQDLDQRESELKTLQQLMEVVGSRSKEAYEVVRNFPLGRNRTEWLRAARAQVETHTSLIAAERAELDRDIEFEKQGLFPPPRLRRGTPAPGDFGFVQAHVRVTRVLDDGSFLAQFGEDEVHWRGFGKAAPESGKLALISAMCVAVAPYHFTNTAGAPETAISIEPLDERAVPAWYREALKKRVELQTARLKSRLEAWHERTARSQAAVEAGAPLPSLGTRFEPATLIEIISGDKTLKAPNLPKKYRNEVVTIRYPRLGGRGGGVVYDEARSVRRVETEESRQWRRQQLAEFNALRGVYPAYSLTEFIRELQTWSTDSDLIYNHQGELREDIDKLIKLAFTDYGISGPRVRDIPWTPQAKQQIIGHLQQIALRYGELDSQILAAVEESAAEQEPDGAEREQAAAAQLELAQR
ncbi:MAG: S1C family serine protease, partial [Planctomycetes bacterium]|nr:S1C family serine protease [Planctomycetota bacterium]